MKQLCKLRNKATKQINNYAIATKREKGLRQVINGIMKMRSMAFCCYCR